MLNTYLTDSVADYLEMGYNAILHPDSDVIYFLHEQGAPQRDDCIYKKYSDQLQNMLEPESTMWSIHASLNEMIGFLEVERDGDEAIHWEGKVDMLNLPLKPLEPGRYEHDTEWSFLISWRDGKWTIRSFYREEDWFLSREVGAMAQVWIWHPVARWRHADNADCHRKRTWFWDIRQPGNNSLWPRSRGYRH